MLITTYWLDQCVHMYVCVRVLLLPDNIVYCVYMQVNAHAQV